MTTVLFVEDEPQIARALAINLRARGWKVLLAPDGRQALQLAARRPPDVVVLDLGLPDLDGVEVIAGLRGWTRVPIIVLSARQDSGDEGRGARRGRRRLRHQTVRDGRAAGPAAGGRCAAPARAAGAAADRTSRPAAVDLARKKVARDGADVRLTPTEWHLLEVLVRNRGRLVSQRQLLQRGVGACSTGRRRTTCGCTWPSCGASWRTDPAHPAHLITEPGMGYRFEL